MKKCTKCGILKALEEFHRYKQGYRSVCKGCRSLEAKPYYQKNKDRINKRSVAWQKANPEKAAEFRNNWEERNRPRRLAQKLNNKYKNTETHEKHNERTRIWTKKNRDRCNINRNRYEARKAQVEINDFTLSGWKDLLKNYENKCFYCKQYFENLEIEHQIPISRGGNHTASNIVPACKTCNTRKGNKTPEEYLSWLEEVYGKCEEWLHEAVDLLEED